MQPESPVHVYQEIDAGDCHVARNREGDGTGLVKVSRRASVERRLDIKLMFCN